MVHADTGKPIQGDSGAALTRQISLMIPSFGFVDAAMVLSPERRRFGDQWAKTTVVKSRPDLDAEAKG